MKTIRISLTDQNRILVPICPTELTRTIQNKGNIIHEWFYNKPKELEFFFIQNPHQKVLFAEAFEYWLTCKVYNIQEKQRSYRPLKRELKSFSAKLFKAIRALTRRIADQIVLFKKKLQGNFNLRYVNKKHANKNK